MGRTRREDMGRDNAQALVNENKGRSKTIDSNGLGKSRSQSQKNEKNQMFLLCHLCSTSPETYEHFFPHLPFC